MDVLFYNVSFRTSKLVTTTYSTSFSVGVRCLHPSIREAIYSIYGFVRFADEIVDTFHDYNKEELLKEFEEEYYKAINRGISMNPIINSFRHTVENYQIDDELVQAFLKSMRSDLYHTQYEKNDIREYIYGSAEVVGLMCLQVFVGGDKDTYERLKPYAMRLGAAFQKVNFLRDLQHDTSNLHRTYFPELKNRNLDEETKKMILADIYEDYRVAKEGIRQLPSSAKLGVYTAYLYFLILAKRIEATPAEKLMNTRIRVANYEKVLLFGQAYLTHNFV